MDKKIIIEVCCGSIDDAIIAYKSGADRIEINSSLFFGGLTPSIGTIIEIKKTIDIPVMVMIRPRNGGFCYTENELRVMEQDIKMALASGADGIVFGILKENGKIDIENSKRFVELIGDKESVFHRAFDVTPDPFEALDTLYSLGIKRVLTKGQQNTFEEGETLLKELVKYSNKRVEILPSGCRPHNIERIIKEVKCDQVHIASFISQTDLSINSNPNLYFGGVLRPSENAFDIANGEYIGNIKNKIDSITNF